MPREFGGLGAWAWYMRVRIKRRNTEARGEIIVDFFRGTKRLRLDMESFLKVPGLEGDK